MLHASTIGYYGLETHSGTLAISFDQRALHLPTPSMYVYQYIVGKVNEMLMVKPAQWDTSISLPYRCELGIFLERKSFTGVRSDKLEYRPAPK